MYLHLTQYTMLELILDSHKTYGLKIFNIVFASQKKLGIVHWFLVHLHSHATLLVLLKLSFWFLLTFEEKGKFIGLQLIPILSLDIEMVK